MKSLMLFLLTTACGLSATAQLSNGLIAYYPFTNGSTANQAPTAFSTLFAQQTSPTADAQGATGQALAFSGSAPQLWVSSGDLIDFGLTTSFSFITDFKSGSAATQYFFRDLLINGHGWHIGFLHSTGYITFESGTGSSLVSIHTTSTFNDLAWHQVALLVDKNSMTIRLYVDNVLQELAGTVCDEAVSGTVADIGECNFNANEDNAQLTTFGENLQGALDEIRLYGRLLSEAEVGEAYELSFDLTTAVETPDHASIIDRFDPTTGSLVLEGVDQRPALLTMTDQTGKVVRVQHTGEGTVRAELGDLASGPYIVRLQREGATLWWARYVWVR